MVKKYQKINDVIGWLNFITQSRSDADRKLLQAAIDLFPANSEAELKNQIELVDILFSLNLDTETLAVALVYPVVKNYHINLDIVTDHLGESCRKLLQDILQIQSLEQFRDIDNRPAHHIENLRKMLLAMVTDVRSVFIILAERLWLLRNARDLSAVEQKKLAKETQDVYAPLANRLGIWQLKWEIEDFCLRYLDKDTYMAIAKSISAKRVEREIHIKEVKDVLCNALKSGGLTHFDISGRVKHIYSIYKKMKRKNANISQIYDMSALRILVDTVEDCYTALSILQNTWKQIPEEFDDYIAQPKANGYRSVHIVLIDPNNHVVEVQIRTYEMHQESELGVAAHWRYKEGILQPSNYEAKIALLRQIFEWQKEVSESKQSNSNKNLQNLFEDRVYVFTPTGDIIDLPNGSTPLDFAYYIHSEVGHRCRGAKINGDIVPLTYHLKIGDHVEILTAKHANPSRDWLNVHYGYIHTARARAKIQHWFRAKDSVHQIVAGREILEKELKRLKINIPYDIESIAKQLKYKSSDGMFIALAAGVIKLPQITHYILPSLQNLNTPNMAGEQIGSKSSSQHTILGVSNLLTHIAQCCKPIPGDIVNGYITKTRGVSIHRKGCSNLQRLIDIDGNRSIDVNLEKQDKGLYTTDLVIYAVDRLGLLRDITALLIGEKINLLAINTKTELSIKEVNIYLTISVHDINELNHIMHFLKHHVDNIINVERR